MAVDSAAQLPAVTQTISRLQALLDRAEVLKPQHSTEPALVVSEFLSEVNSLHDDFPEEYDQVYRFNLVETATREIFYALIRSIDIYDAQFVKVWHLLDIILMCGDHGICTPELICWLIEELLDSQTTQGCRKVFDYLETRRERLSQKDFHKKNLVFLRSCNELLRRLSRAEDAIFCGRVFFFLFQTFPLGDKSSVNLRGEFHVDNTTKFDDSTTAAQDAQNDAMDIDDSNVKAVPIESASAAGKSATSKKSGEIEVLSNDDLYPIFWRLQHDFSNPTRLYESRNFSAFKEGLQHTIAKFKNSPTVVQTKPVESDKNGTKRGLSEGSDRDGGDTDLVDNYNPKYLTSRDLFHLEFSDLAFQRHILVQALILIDFLLSLSEAAKKKREVLNFPNKALLYAYTLSEEDAKWASSTRTSITAYLSATRDGREYFRMIETVLARDKNWIRWKMESCPSIVRGPVATEFELAARKGVQDATRPRRVPERHMGMNLGFLDESNTGGGMLLLKTPTRYVSSSIEQLVNGIKMDQLDAEMADDDEALRLNNAIANKKWRALRRVRATNLASLDKVESTKDLDLEVALVAQEVSAEQHNPVTNGDGTVDVTPAANAEADAAVAIDE